MIKYLTSITLIICLFLNFNACTENKEQEQVNYPVTNDFLVDSQATVETVALYEFLRTFAGTGTMFGHQDDLAYGIGWWAQVDHSDVKAVCGDYPAVIGWDLGLSLIHI